MNEMVHITFGRTVIAVRRNLILPDDPVLRGQFEVKLQEYRSRLLVPGISPHREASTNYKIWVLQQLLDQRELDFLLLKAAVARDAPNQTLAIAYLAYAWKVIENYCYNRGEQNRGGTGLPTNTIAASTQPRPVEGTGATPVPQAPFADRPAVAIPMEEADVRPRSSRIPEAQYGKEEPEFILPGTA